MVKASDEPARFEILLKEGNAPPGLGAGGAVMEDHHDARDYLQGEEKDEGTAKNIGPSRASSYFLSKEFSDKIGKTRPAFKKSFQLHLKPPSSGVFLK